MISPASVRHDNPSRGGQLALLHRIAQDDEFRTRLENDPEAALSEYDVRVDSRSLPQKVTLPDEDELSTLVHHLESGLRPPWIPWASWVVVD